MTDDPSERFRRLLKSEEETQAEPPPEPARVTGTTPRRPLPALDKDNMPLPRRVTETDMGGTTVTPAAFETRTGPRPNASPPRTGITRPRKRNGGAAGFIGRLASRGCLAKGLVVVLFLLVIMGLCLGS